MNSSLTVATGTATINWNQTNPITGFDPSSQQSKLYIKATPEVGTSDATVPFQISGTLAFGASVTLDLYSFTDAAFGQAILAERGYNIGFKGSGATWSVGPAAALGLAWFLGGTTPTVQGGDGEGFAFIGKIAVTISNGVKKITITNTSAGDTLTYTLGATLGAP